MEDLHRQGLIKAIDDNTVHTNPNVSPEISPPCPSSFPPGTWVNSTR